MVVIMIVVVVIVVMIMMIVTVAFLTVLVVMVLMIVVVIVSACTLVLVYVEVYAGILHRVHHGMLQVALIHIDDRSHEVEIRLFGRFQTIVVLHTHIEIGEIQCYSFSIDGDGHLDVPHQVTCFLLHPPADLHHHSIQPCFRIGIETVDVSGETYTDTACQFF